MIYVIYIPIALLVLMSACLGDEIDMKVDAPLSKEMETTRSSEQGIPVIVTFESSDDVQSLMAKGVKPRMVYQNIPAMAATLNTTQIRDIALMPQVKSIELDSEAKALSKP